MVSFAERTELLIGCDGLDKLHKMNVLVAGVGGVGSIVAEMLCRSGVGNMTIIDADTVSSSNINRQIIALHSTVGEKKIDVLEKRLLDINPNVNVRKISILLEDTNIKDIILSEKYDFVVDAIDTLSPKVSLIKNCVENGIEVISSMGAGAKLHPENVQIADISKSYNCALARMVRKRLTKFGIKKGIKVVFSSEKPIKSALKKKEERYKKTMTGTISYLPPMFGLYIASYIIRSVLVKE